MTYTAASSTAEHETRTESQPDINEPMKDFYGKVKFTFNHSNAKEYADVIILCGQDIYYAHKFVICSQSVFFKNACKLAWKESAENKIVLHEDPHVVKLVLEYMYSKSWIKKCYILQNKKLVSIVKGNSHPFATLVKVFCLARQWIMQPLQDCCLDHFTSECCKGITRQSQYDFVNAIREIHVNHVEEFRREAYKAAIANNKILIETDDPVRSYWHCLLDDHPEIAKDLFVALSCND